MDSALRVPTGRARRPERVAQRWEERRSPSLAREVHQIAIKYQGGRHRMHRATVVSKSHNITGSSVGSHLRLEVQST